MSKGETPKQPKPKGNARDDRLKQALKANLARRKAQARVRDVEKPRQNEDDDV